MPEILKIVADTHCPDTPRIVMPAFAPRGDRVSGLDMRTTDGQMTFWNKLKSEPNYFGTDSLGNIAVAINPSPHTDVMTTSPANEKIPAHFTVWQNKPTSSTEYPDILDSNFMACAITDAVGYLNNKTDKLPIIYQLVGFNYGEKIGLGRGCQSNPLKHIHVVTEPQVTNGKTIHEAGQKKVDQLKEKMNYTGSVNKILEDVWVPLLTNILEKAGCKVEEYRNPNNTELVGANVKTKDEPGLDSYLSMTELLTIKLNQVYDILMKSGEKVYCSPVSEKNQIMNGAIKQLVTVGLTESLASEVLDLSRGFRPTLAQVELWLSKPDIGKEAKDNLNKIRSKYLRWKSVLQEPGSNNIQRIKSTLGTDDLGIEFLKEQLGIYPDDKAFPELTLSSHASWRWIISDYELNPQGKVQVNSMHVFPQIISAGGNTIENQCGILVDREK